MRYLYQSPPLLFVSILTAFFFNVAIAEASIIIRPPNNLGLVGYWSFDEGRGTQASDLSGNGNNGTLVNGPSWVSGRSGRGLAFDGVDDYVSVGDIGSPQQFTFSFWVNPDELNVDANNNYRRIITSSVSAGNFVIIEQTGVVSLRIPGVNTSYYGAGNIPLDTWSFVTAVYNQSERQIYINGALEGAQTIGSGTVNLGTIGFTQSLDRSFSGQLDEVRAYSRALSASEILSLYSNTKSTVVGEAPANYYSDGLVAHYTFDGSSLSGSTVSDVVGESDGTLTAGPVPTLGRIGQGMLFNGTTGGISLGSPAALQITGDQTIAMWVYAANFSARRNPYAKAYGGEGTITQELSGVLNYYYGISGVNGGSYQGFGSTTPLTLNTWNHIALVRDLSSSPMRLRWYINGTETSATNATYAAAVAGTLPALIGQGYVSRYAGVIDDVRIYNRALSANEVRGLAGGGVGTIDSSNLFLLFDDFNDNVLDSSRWQTFGASYGTISESSGEVTITNSTGSSTNSIGIASQVRFPIGTTLKARVKNTQGRHSALVAIGESPFHPYPHAGGANIGVTLYSRADVTTAAISLRREDAATATGTPAVQDYRNYQVVELRRVTANLVEFYVDDVKAGEFTTAGLSSDYFVYFSADGHIKPNTIVIDWVEVTN